ncbi:MAG TPA: hypothetical protein VGM68_07055 [Rhizomicrobium sp.]|jgi:hypothetical protein
MKHILFAVVAAAALAVIGPRLSQEPAAANEVITAPAPAAPSDHRATPLHSSMRTDKMDGR